jgi:hypothetical protein
VVDLTGAQARGRLVTRVRGCVGLAVAAALLLAPAGGDAENVLTPGVAAGGVRLDSTVNDVRAILGAPSSELKDPTNAGVIIQRWESQCLGARYTPAGRVLALDVWTDVGEQCGGRAYVAEGARGSRVTLGSARAQVKAAFGYAPSRLLSAPAFTVFVYEEQGIAFYVRDEGLRQGQVDAMTVFHRGDSRSVWAPRAWGGR